MIRLDYFYLTPQYLDPKLTVRYYYYSISSLETTLTPTLDLLSTLSCEVVSTKYSFSSFSRIAKVRIF